EYGFTSVFVKNEEKPTFLLCHNVLSSERMKPNKFQRHLETLHKEYVGNPKLFFQLRKEGLSHQQVQFKRALSVSAQWASFEMSHRITQAKKPLSIGGTFILPAAVDMVGIMCGEIELNKLAAIPLFNNTEVKDGGDSSKSRKHPCGMSEKHAFALQVNLSTEGHDAHPLAFVQHLWEGVILKDILFCLPLPGHKTAQEIFNVLPGYIKDNDIPFDVMVLSDRITAFLKQMAFWKNNLLKSNYESFPQLCKFLADIEIIQSPTQISQLETWFASFFLQLRHDKI
ncbi:F200B protein, partial [Polyodon spathula]|nr:F200B protein [Polyodon spathula]